MSPERTRRPPSPSPASSSGGKRPRSTPYPAANAGRPRGARVWSTAGALLLALLPLPATSARAQEEPPGTGAQPSRPRPHPQPAFTWLSGGLHSAFASDLINGSWRGLTFGAELKLGHREPGPRGLGGFLQLDVAHWFGPQVPGDDASHPFAATLQVALNIGVGMDVVYFDRRMRAAFSGGPSVLLRDNSVGNAGAVGVFVDLRPVGVRVRFARAAVLVIDPLTFTMLLPDLTGIPLVQIEYRTVLAVEFGVRERSR